MTIETPHDREGTFDLQTVKKRETILAEGMADQIIGMYAFGTSTWEISRYFEKEFDTKLSAETISATTDHVLPEIREWKSRMLEPVYAICWLDAIRYKKAAVPSHEPSATCLASTKKAARICRACTYSGARVPISGLRC